MFSIDLKKDLSESTRVLHELDLRTLGEENFGSVKSRLYVLSLPWRRRLVEFVANDVLSKNPRSVLDIGCGTGDILAQLGRSRVGIELYGIDPSIYMLRLAKKRVAESVESSEAHLRLGSSRLIPFDRKFDVVFSSLSFHHWNDREESVPQILTRLDEKGEFTIYEYKREELSLILRSVLGKHALSAADVNRLHFDCYEKTVEHSGPFIVVRFKRDGKGRRALRSR